MKKTIEKALNDQLNLEYQASYVYLAMSAYFDEHGLGGISKWMRKQGEEEIAHMKKIYDFLFDRNSNVIFNAVSKPKQTWKSVLDIFKAALKHEETVTHSIHRLVELATKEQDHATVTFLNWFVEEQVEEEASIRHIIQQLEFVDGDKRAILLLDKELGSREA